MDASFPYHVPDKSELFDRIWYAHPCAQRALLFSLPGRRFQPEGQKGGRLWPPRQRSPEPARTSHGTALSCRIGSDYFPRVRGQPRQLHVPDTNCRAERPGPSIAPSRREFLPTEWIGHDPRLLCPLPDAFHSSGGVSDGLPWLRPAAATLGRARGSRGVSTVQARGHLPPGARSHRGLDADSRRWVGPIMSDAHIRILGRVARATERFAEAHARRRYLRPDRVS
jgi:hypothetical protein